MNDFVVDRKKGESKSATMIWNTKHNRWVVDFCNVDKTKHNLLYLALVAPKHVHIFLYDHEIRETESKTLAFNAGTDFHTVEQGERDLLKKLGAEGDEVIASALNDYIVEIPMTDFTEFDVIVAYSMDGQPLRRNDKGPLWIVYPRDQHQALQDIRFDYRWVWQLSRLEVQ